METNIGLSLYSSKKRKEIDRKINGYKEDYKWLLEDVSRIREHDQLKKKMNSGQNDLSYLENYSKIHIDKICQILLTDGYIIEKDGGFQLTAMGEIAANIHEIHPLIAANMITRFNWFESISVYDIIAFFSIFTDVHVPEDSQRLDITGFEYIFVKNLAEDYAMREHDVGLFTGISYDKMYVYDLVKEMSGWIACDTEEACKYFIQTVIMERGISIGDFSKAILKISVICKEFAGVCEQCGDAAVECLYKLKQVDSLILKYVATAQSLYV
jgi:hypothetical protein